MEKENIFNEAPLPNHKESGETEELLNNNFTICSDCGSSIEILSISENNSFIEYKCLNEKNKHSDKTHFKEAIKVYLEKIKELKENKIDELKDRCHIENHNLNNYVSYCLDCRCHLCVECLKKREHINHRKSNMIEIKPVEKELELIKEVIKYCKNERKGLEDKKKKHEEEINKSLNQKKEEKEKEYKIKLKDNEEKK